MIDCFSALSRIDSLTLSSFSRQNTHPRALLYEKLSKYYLLSSPLWKDEIKNAWLWADPKNPLNPPSSPRPDFGIDLVALDFDGNFWSCQVKERSTSFSSLSWRDLSTFASASEYFAIPPSRRILFLFSSSLSSNSLFQIEGYKVITEDSMEKEGIDFAPLFEEGAKDAKKENSRLRPYQVDAVEKCMEGFEKEDKGQLIMACGTGKTITGLSIAEQMAKRKEGPFFSLCLVPSIQLLTQTLIYWKKHCALPFTAQAICSDSGANGEENSPSYLEERNIPRVAKTAKDILSPQGEGFYSLFCTYPSLPKVIEAQKMGLPAFDLCIADEAHRTTSKNLWGKIHFGGLKAQKTLFMTATPRLKEEGEGPSMDDSSFFGRPFFTYSFERAIKENYLSDYRVLLYAVRGGEREEETAGKILASFDSFFTDPSDFQSVFGLEKVKAFSLPLSSSFKTPFVKRAIFFCRTIEESKKVSSHFEEVLKGKGLPLGKAEIKHIDGSEKASEKRRKIEWLKEGKEGKVRVLSNSKCLTEGIDVPSLEAVVFFDPKNSDVDVTQAVGRVIRHSDTKPFGLVVVPVVLGEKESIREAGRNKKYQGLIKILKKLREMDPSLDLALSTERGERKRKERKEEEEEEEFSLEGLGEVLDKEIREEIPPSPIRFAFSRAFNLLGSFAEENPKEWEKAKERFSFLKEEKLKEEISLHVLLSPFFSSLSLDPLFSFVESFTKKAFKDGKEVLKLQDPGKEIRQKFPAFSPFYSSFLKEALGEEKGEEEDPSASPQDLLSLLSLLLERVKKEEGKDPKGPIFDPYSGDGSLLSFFEKEEKEKGEGEEKRLIPYYMAKEKGLSCSLSDSFPKEKPSLLASNLLNFSSLKKEVEGGGNGEKELREAFKRAKETLKEGGIALFISPSLFLENFSFPLEDLEGFSSLYSLSLRGSNGIRKPDAGENVMDERSSVSLLCLVKGEGELKARGMEVGKDLSRKEKITQAKTLLEEGEWKGVEKGRKVGRNMSKQNLIIKALPQVTTKSALAPLLRKAYYLNWSSAFCNKGISSEVIQNAVTQLENDGTYVTPEEFIKALANVLAQKPDIRKDRKAGVGLKASTLGTRQPRNSKVVTTKLPKKEVDKTQLLPTHEIAKLVATLHIQEGDLQEVVSQHDYDSAKTLQAELDATQQELNDALAPYVTQEQAIASTTQEVDELEHKTTLARNHYKEVIQQLASLRLEAINAEREANTLEQNLENRKSELAKLEAGKYSLSDDYVTLDKETGVICGTQLIHIPSQMVQTLDNLRSYLAKAEAINADEFVQKDRLATLKALKDNFIKLGMPMPADLQKELEKIERGYQRWLNAK